MENIQSFNADMIQTAVETLQTDYEFDWTQDDDGDFCLQFGFQEDWGCELTAWLMTDGDDQDLYWIQVVSDRRIPQGEWDRTVWLCNTWNKEWTYPKAYLEVGEGDEESASPEGDGHVDEDGTTEGQVYLEQYLYLAAGVHQELLNDSTTAILSNSFEFWKWVHADHDL